MQHVALSLFKTARRALQVLAVTGVLGSLVGCGTSDNQATCVDGASAACACTDGQTGAQVCSQGAFEPCLCVGDTGTSDARVPDVDVPDGGPNDPDGETSETSETTDPPDSIEPDGDTDEVDLPDVAIPDTDAGDLDDADASDVDPAQPDVEDTDLADAGPTDTTPTDAEPTDADPADADPDADDISDDISDVATDPDTADTTDTADVADTADTADVADTADATDASDTSDTPDAADVADTTDTTDVGDTPPDLPVNPCGDITETGRCRSGTVVEYCGTVAGSGERAVLTYTCPFDDRCRIQSGVPVCVMQTECRAGSVQCDNATTLATCNARGTWVRTTCPSGCVVDAAGPVCGEPPVGNRITSRVFYHVRQPNAGFTDWGAPVYMPAPRLMALSYDGDTLIDSAYLSDTPGEEGTFSLTIPAVLSGDERIILAAGRVNDRGEWILGVADPGTDLGEVDISTFSPGSVSLWHWSFATSDVVGLPEFGINEIYGSAAIRLYAWLDASYSYTREVSGRGITPRVLMWMGLGTSWSCGACAAEWPYFGFGTRWEHQIWLDGGENQGYWSDPVTVHEIAHVIMGAWGRSPGEGGRHVLGVPTHPGIGWSEGWATAYSSLFRENPRYWDKQQFGMFWFDIERRLYSSGTTWRRASASHADGLLQRLDENEIAAMTWALGDLLGLELLHDALESARMRTPPFERGYTTRYWEGLNDRYEPDPWVDTRQSAPMFADFLDALRCAGVITVAQTNTITSPTTRYPYPANSPFCR